MRSTPGIESALMDNGVAGITGHEQDLEVRLKLLGVRGELAAAGARHDDIGEEKIDPVGEFITRKASLASEAPRT